MLHHINMVNLLIGNLQKIYPCNVDVWGDLASQPIRHHKFPDVLVSPIFENPVYLFSNLDCSTSNAK